MSDGSELRKVLVINRGSMMMIDVAEVLKLVVLLVLVIWCFFL